MSPGQQKKVIHNVVSFQFYVKQLCYEITHVLRFHFEKHQMIKLLIKGI